MTRCTDCGTVWHGKPVFRATDRHGRATWIVERGPGSRFPLGGAAVDERTGADGYPSDPQAILDGGTETLRGVR